MLQKIIFKSEIKEILLEHILKRRYKPGQRLSLTTLANSLEVSVTPIREALTQLSETGIITYISNRGFFLAELSIKEAGEIYELVGLLESNALKKCTFKSEQLNELALINKKFSYAQDPFEILKYDRQFHQKLIENYKNTSALKIIEILRIRISLYEYEFWNQSQQKTSIETHDNIIKSLRSHDYKTATNLVNENWEISVQYIIDQLETI